MKKYFVLGLLCLLSTSAFAQEIPTSTLPSVRLRANGVHDVLNLPYGATVVLSWNTEGIKSCAASTDGKTNLSGTQWKGKLASASTKTVTLTKRTYSIEPFVFIIECVRPNGNKLRDEVRVATDPLQFLYPTGGEMLTAGTNVLIRHAPIQIKSTEYRLKTETGDTYKLKGKYVSDSFLWDKGRYLVGKKEKGLVPDGRYSLIVQMTSTKQIISKSGVFIASTNPAMRKPEGLAILGNKLVWTTISEASGYDVYRNTSMDGNIITRPCTSLKPYTSDGCYQTTKGVASITTLSGLKKGSTHYFKIRSRNAYGEVSDWSDWKEVLM